MNSSAYVTTDQSGDEWCKEKQEENEEREKKAEERKWNYKRRPAGGGRGPSFITNPAYGAVDVVLVIGRKEESLRLVIFASTKEGFYGNVNTGNVIVLVH